MHRLSAVLLIVGVAVACSSGTPREQDSAGDAKGDGPTDGEAGPVDAARDARQKAPDAARPADATSPHADATSPLRDAAFESGAADAADASNVCSVDGAPGACASTSGCAALGNHTSYAGYCPGPASIECCIVTPNVEDNPPTPVGYVLMQQSQVTAAMTTWAVMILNDPSMYPLFSTATMTFGGQFVLARVEWHPPDFQNSVIHRGVTLYVPVG